jgi:preprotein translocase subunit YajC
MYCKECGHQIANDSKFCASCGKPQNAGTVSKNIFADIKSESLYGNQSQPKSQVIALILWFFLAGFHRFYVGKIGTGILMLLMWFFVIFGMTVKEKAEIASIFETGRNLSQTGDTIVTISGVLAIILVIWELVDLIRIINGSFTKVSNPKIEYVSSGSMIMRKKDVSHMRNFFTIILMAALFTISLYEIYERGVTIEALIYTILCILILIGFLSSNSFFKNSHNGKPTKTKDNWLQ